jgi:hypothetical protein
VVVDGDEFEEVAEAGGGLTLMLALGRGFFLLLLLLLF